MGGGEYWWVEGWGFSSGNGRWEEMKGIKRGKRERRSRCSGRRDRPFIANPISLCGFFFQLCQAFHQATFAPGGVVAVDNAFLGGLVQGADGLQGSGAGFFQTAVCNLTLCFPDECARSPAKDTVAQSLFLVLLVTFDSRFNIRQKSFLRNFYSLSRLIILLHSNQIVQQTRGPVSTSVAMKMDML
jgi:hypothetical protein